MRRSRRISEKRLAWNAGLGSLGVALALGLLVPAGAATLHLRNGSLAIECHWDTDDGVIVTRGGTALRVPRGEIDRIEDASSAASCPAIAPAPTMTLGEPPVPPQTGSVARGAPIAAPSSVPVLPVEAGLTSAQRQALAEVREFAGAFASAYHLPATIEVSVMKLGSTNLDSLANVGVVYSLGKLLVDPGLLEAPTRDVLIAKVLALQLAPRVHAADSLADYQRQRRHQSFEANAKAVEVLVQIKGWTERTALQRVHAWLLGLNVRGVPPREGQPTPCEQIVDLLARFPDQKDWMAGASCSPTPAGGVSAPART